MTWSTKELRRIAETDDLHIAPFRDDGATYGTLTWIWSVVVEDAVYVRGHHGQASRWYQAAVRQKAGRIAAAGMTREAAFEAVDVRRILKEFDGLSTGRAGVRFPSPTSPSRRPTRERISPRSDRVSE
jgi:hypothetical protein